MLAKVMVEGEASDYQSQALPVVAKAFHLRVTSTKFPDGNKRSLLEAHFVAHVLDHLAARRYGQAADLLAQRYTAIEAVLGGMPWEKAKFLELIGEEDSSLVGQSERALVANETAMEMKVGNLGPAPYGNGWKGQAPPPRWNGWKGGKSNPFGDQAADHGAPVQPAAAALQDGGLSNKGKGKDKGKDRKGKGKGKGKDW